MKLAERESVLNVVFPELTSELSNYDYLDPLAVEVTENNNLRFQVLAGNGSEFISGRYLYEFTISVSYLLRELRLSN